MTILNRKMTLLIVSQLGNIEKVRSFFCGHAVFSVIYKYHQLNSKGENEYAADQGRNS